MKILINRKGFNLIEVIVGIVILSIIASSLALLFSINLDLPYIQNRTEVYTYAQNEMEKLNNKSFSEINSIVKNNYPDDPNYDYEIIVDEDETKPNLKEVTINFYPHGKNDKVAELFSEFILLTTKICEDFEVNGDSAPPWDWTKRPQGQWNVVNFNGSNRLSYGQGNEGHAYPDWSGSSNYSLKGRIYITDPGFFRSSYIYIGGRCNSSGYGYFIRIESIDFLILSFTYVNLVKITSSGETNLLSETFFNDIFDQWVNVELRMDGNMISYYFNDELIGSVNDPDFTSGTIYLKANCGRNNRNIYFDDICVEEIQWKMVFH